MPAAASAMHMVSQASPKLPPGFRKATKRRSRASAKKKENETPQNETPMPLARGSLEETPEATVLSKSIRGADKSSLPQGLPEDPATKALPPQSPISQVFEVFEEQVFEAFESPAATPRSAASETALAGPVRGLSELAQPVLWEGDITVKKQIKNTFIDFFVDPPPSTSQSQLFGKTEPKGFAPQAFICHEEPEPATPVALSEEEPEVVRAAPESRSPRSSGPHEEPTSFPQQATQVKNTFIDFCERPATTSQLSGNSEPRDFAPQTFICHREPEPEAPVVVSLQNALGAPSTSMPQRGRPSNPIQLNLSMWIPPEVPNSRASAASEPPLPLRLAEHHFPAPAQPAAAAAAAGADPVVRRLFQHNSI